MKTNFNTWSLLLPFLFLLNSCGTKQNIDAENNENKKQKQTKQIKEIITTTDNPEPIFWKEISKFNKRGNIEEELNFNKGDVLSSKRVYSYDSTNKLIEYKYISAGFEELNTRTFYHYDVMGVLESHIEMDNSNKITLESHYTYDKQGRLLKQEFSSGFTRSHKFCYHPNNIVKSKIYVNEDGTKDTENFNEKGLKLGDKKNKYKYDSKGNPVEEIHDETYGYSKFVFEYKYNSQGDWFERKTYYSDLKNVPVKLQHTDKRVITYYP